jgi:predicted transcriptional regulator
MTTTTIRVSRKTRELLHQLATTAGTSAQQVLEVALEQYQRRQFLESLNKAYSAAQNNEETAQVVRQEQLEWDRTLLDGLEPTEEWE